MFSQLRYLGAAIRHSPLYAGLLGLGLTTFLLLGLRGGRLLGGDNESTDAGRTGPPRAGGHVGYVHGFNHK